HCRSSIALTMGSGLLSGCPNLEDFKVISVVSASHDSCEEFKSLTKLIRAEILCCNINFILE
ncbi:hypothetical protein, partial [Serratia marcescens]|uniref:hypothetical protein n=1 Tax=Serratia marcescens TaxID=615 RepID=UPI0019540132